MTYTLIIILIISVLLNLALILYSVNAARKLFVVSSNIDDLQESLLSFKNHTQAIYELEMYYGDDTLKNLIDHSQELLQQIEQYEDIYSLAYDDEQDLNFDSEEIQETTL